MLNSRANRRRRSRRRFLQVGTSGLLGLGLEDLLRADLIGRTKQPTATGMILVWLSGGPATIDMWDPKREAPEEIRGAFHTIPTTLPGVHFSEHMPHTARVLDRSVLIRSLHHNIPDHGPGTQYVMTGNKPSASLDYPSVGSLAAHLLPGPAGIPSYFTFGEAANSGAGFLGAAYNPFRVESPGPRGDYNLEGVTLPDGMSVEQLADRRRLSEAFGTPFRMRHADVDVVPTLTKFQQLAHDILASDLVGKAFDLTSEPEAIQKLYGNSELGRNALIARRLIETGARFVTLGTGGWDTHSGNFSTLRRLLPPLDQALGALVSDLDQRGMLDETIVGCGGEFGRTPTVNAAGGRDHWSRAMSFFMSGGGLKHGYVHGSTDPRGYDPTGGGCSPDDLAATLLALLGFPPNHRVLTTTGRPVEVVQNGTAIAEIMA